MTQPVTNTFPVQQSQECANQNVAEPKPSRQGFLQFIITSDKHHMSGNAPRRKKLALSQAEKDYLRGISPVLIHKQDLEMLEGRTQNEVIRRLQCQEELHVLQAETDSMSRMLQQAKQCALRKRVDDDQAA
eukprot:c16295_g1_i1.p1 GENE.c16295_g1_i1~~c16295_g1_i1.p1  ORF type:complete len:131 (+),score=24.26 c16295_g1_i1:125-517(+)